mgnify:CR=1 FL=1
MSREIRARIGAARLLLQSLDGDNLLQASRTQRDALLETVQRNPLSPEEQASCSELAMSVHWHEIDRAAIAQAFIPASKAKRCKMQNFETLHEYLTELEMSHLMSNAVSMTAKEDIILGRALTLGCRCPSEGSLKYFTSLILVVSESKEKLLVLSPQQKVDQKTHVKALFKQRMRGLDKPPVYLTELPVSPLQLRSDHPEFFEAVYKDDCKPSKCNIDLKQAHMVSNSFKCRGNPSSASLPSSPTLQLDGGGYGQLERFAGTMIDNLCRMQANQQRADDMNEICNTHVQHMHTTYVIHV